jgi:hypothetical protein
LVLRPAFAQMRSDNMAESFQRKFRGPIAASVSPGAAVW